MGACVHASTHALSLSLSKKKIKVFIVNKTGMKQDGARKELNFDVGLAKPGPTGRCSGVNATH